MRKNFREKEYSMSNPFFSFDENERPLDACVTDGGFCGILRKVAFVGDSLSSGEFQLLEEGHWHYIDRFDYSFGQYFARMAGVTAYNFSRGGMTASEYCQTFAGQFGYWSKDLAANAYVIALGVNDLFGQRQEVGSIADVAADWHDNKQTFAGWYAQVIQRYKEIAPDAKFFLVTMPEEPDGDELHLVRHKEHAALMYDFAKYFKNTYVIDLYRYAPTYDKAFKEKFYLNGHLNAAGYLLTARMLTSYIDYIIRHDLAAFQEIGVMDLPDRDDNETKKNAEDKRP